MYENAFELEIVAPEKVVYKGRVTSVSAPGVLGNFQVLYNHAPLLSALEVGSIKVKLPEGKDVLFATSGGFLEVRNNAVVILADTAELPSEISVERAEAARARAEGRLHERKRDIDVERARLALARAVNRLRVAKLVES